jgi:PAS domain S-box-containing protein
VTVVPRLAIISSDWRWMAVRNSRRSSSGNSSCTLLPGGLRDNASQELANLLGTGDTARRGLRRRVMARRKDGSPFNAEIDFTPIDVNGVRFITAFARDISETMQAEQQLMQA